MMDAIPKEKAMQVCAGIRRENRRTPTCGMELRPEQCFSSGGEECSQE